MVPSPHAAHQLFKIKTSIKVLQFTDTFTDKTKQTSTIVLASANYTTVLGLRLKTNSKKSNQYALPTVQKPQQGACCWLQNRDFYGEIAKKLHSKIAVSMQNGVCESDGDCSRNKSSVSPTRNKKPSCC